MDVVYYVTINGRQVPFWNGVPLAESGAPLDRFPPTWRLTLVQQRPGTVRQRRQLRFKMWTSELSIVNLLPVAARGSAVPLAKNRTTASARRQFRVIGLAFDARSKLARQVAAARPGSRIKMRIRVQATDKNGNRSPVRYATFSVRV